MRNCFFFTGKELLLTVKLCR